MRSRWAFPILAWAAVSLLVVGCARKDKDGKPASMSASEASAPSRTSAPRAGSGEAPNELRSKTLLEAAMRGNVQDVKAHLQRDPDAVNRPDAEGMFPIHRAADQGHADVIRVLLQAGADVNTRHPKVQATPLQYAAMGGHVEAVRTLLNAGAKVDSVDIAGRTPLMWAAMNGRGPVVQELLQHGANREARMKTGMTALQLAEQKGHAEVAKLLRNAR